MTNLIETDDKLHAGIRAIIAEPDRDDFRLMFADRLEELDQLKWAKFVRYQCGDYQRYCTFAKGIRGWKIVSKRMAHDNSLFSGARSASTAWNQDNALLHTVGMHVTLHRGFIRHVECTLEHWLDYGPRICRTNPLQTMGLTNREPLEAHDGFLWWLGDDFTGRVSSRLPAEIYQRLQNWAHKTRHMATYQTRGAACVALFDALIQHARQ